MISRTRRTRRRPIAAVAATLFMAVLGLGQPSVSFADLGPGPSPRPMPGPRPGPGPAPGPVKPLPVRPGPQPAKPMKPGPKVQDPKVREEARAKLLTRVRALRSSALAEVLKPDQGAVTKIVDIAAGFEDRTLAARQEMRKLRHDLEALLKQPKPDDSAINKLLDDVSVQRGKLQQVEDERAAAMRKALTPSQYAKVMIAWPRINRKIQEQLFKALIQSKEGAAAVDEY